MGARAESLAKQYEAKAAEMTTTINRLSDTDWKKTTDAEKWSVGVTAHHVAGAHEPIAGIAKTIASGQSIPNFTMAMLDEAVGPYDNVSVDSFQGLLVDFCKERVITAIVKGLRAISDFDYELQMAQMNQRLAAVETVFVPTSPEWSYLASSLVKEVARFGGDVQGLVPSHVLDRLTERLGGQ